MNYCIHDDNPDGYFCDACNPPSTAPSPAPDDSAERVVQLEEELEARSYDLANAVRRIGDLNTEKTLLRELLREAWQASGGGRSR